MYMSIFIMVYQRRASLRLGIDLSGVSEPIKSWGGGGNGAAKLGGGASGGGGKLGLKVGSFKQRGSREGGCLPVVGFLLVSFMK